MTDRDCFPGGYRKVFRKPWGPVGLLRSWGLGAGSEVLPDKVAKIGHPLSRKSGLGHYQGVSESGTLCIKETSGGVVSVLRPQVVESAFSTPRGCGVFKGSLVCSLSPWGVQGPWTATNIPKRPSSQS